MRSGIDPGGFEGPARGGIPPHPPGGEMAAKRSLQSAEAQFFRTLNRLVEPLVRAGVGSPRLVPSGFVVLETRGRKSGRTRRTPLAATRFGSHVLVATFRGDRSHWVLNLAAEPRTRIWLSGKPRKTRAFVMCQGKRFRTPRSLPAPIQAVARILSPYTKLGWAFAILSPRR
jgi:deazaflavin-dependent oxidoreductase (nitroreductase family)